MHQSSWTRKVVHTRRRYRGMSEHALHNTMVLQIMMHFEFITRWLFWAILLHPGMRAVWLRYYSYAKSRTIRGWFVW
jgi:hypothetical protein